MAVEVQIDSRQLGDFVSYFDIEIKRGTVLAILKYGRVLYGNLIIADLGHPDLLANDPPAKKYILENKSLTAYHDCIAMVDSRQYMTTTSTPKAKINTVRLFTIKGRLTDEVNLKETLATRNIGYLNAGASSCDSRRQLR